ncbi:MAG: tetratricopeptide repeat protein [Acidobacteria bacterium]|nr:tetratricopeptide repeat protein [Acidobacteriota bacterium]MBI3472086.1 tetratricopeptide repeat protein [Candidatus Solibacter usitatus]
MTSRLGLQGLTVLALAGMAMSCAQRREMAARAPVTAMERQIANAVDAGEGDWVVRSLRQKMAANPDDLTTRLQLMRHFATTGNPDLALEHARLAATRFPASPEIHLEMAKALRALKMRREAAEALDHYLQAHSQRDADYYSWLGILRDELGQFAQAEKAHRAAVTLAPGSDLMHNNLGYCLLLQEKRPEAVEEFRRALKLKPNSETARNNLGLALAGNAQEAIAHWQNVADPATAHSNMAALLIQQRRYEDARKELDIALGYDRKHAAALANLRLVSQLDGKPAVLPVKRVESRWSRVLAVVRKVAGA